MGVMRAARGLLCESCLEVVEVGGIGRMLLDLVEHGEEVMEGVDGGQWWCVGRPGGPSRGGEQERGADELGGYSLSVEVLGEASIGGGSAASGAGGLAVEGEDLADVAVLAGVGHVGVRGAGLGLKSSK
jgi:hypothetical protein